MHGSKSRAESSGTTLWRDVLFKLNISSAHALMFWFSDTYHTSLRRSRFLSFSRRRSDKRALKRASACRLTPSPYSLFFAISRSFRPLRERLEKERKQLLRRLVPYQKYVVVFLFVFFFTRKLAFQLILQS